MSERLRRAEVLTAHLGSLEAECHASQRVLRRRRIGSLKRLLERARMAASTLIEHREPTLSSDLSSARLYTEARLSLSAMAEMLGEMLLRLRSPRRSTTTAQLVLGVLLLLKRVGDLKVQMEQFINSIK